MGRPASHPMPTAAGLNAITRRKPGCSGEHDWFVRSAARARRRWRSWWPDQECLSAISVWSWPAGSWRLTRARNPDFRRLGLASCRGSWVEFAGRAIGVSVGLGSATPSATRIRPNPGLSTANPASGGTRTQRLAGPRAGELRYSGSHRMLKSFLMPKLLKRVQMPGGARCAGYPPQVGRGVLGPYVAAHPLPHGRQWGTMGERANAPRRRNVGNAER
jgi:hypothetical protein